MLIETRDVQHEVQGEEDKHKIPPHWMLLLQQVWRFGLVGSINTALDLLVLNGLLLFFPTGLTWLILIYNVTAYGFGALNSFLLNKYWTFKHKRRITWGELVRFTSTTLLGMVGNTALFWLASCMPHTFITNTVIWTNVSKVLAIFISALISYLGMRLWVFVKH